CRSVGDGAGLPNARSRAAGRPRLRRDERALLVLQRPKGSRDARLRATRPERNPERHHPLLPQPYEVPMTRSRFDRFALFTLLVAGCGVGSTRPDAGPPPICRVPTAPTPP